MKTYIKILRIEIEIILFLILFFAPSIATLILALNVSVWYSFILLTYIFTIPLFATLWENSKVAEWLETLN